MASEEFSRPVQVRQQSCMNGCAKPISMSLQGHGMATYFFSNIDVETDRNDIVKTLRSYIDSPNGWIEDARSCGRLRLCLVGRVPSLSEA